MEDEKRTYLLDTNVLIYDTESIYNFGKNTILISDVTIDELDKLKIEHNERGHDSRSVTNKIKDLLDNPLNKGRTFKEGVICNDDGGLLKIIKSNTSSDLPADKRLIMDADKYGATLLVRDNNLFLLASGNVNVEYYRADSLKTTDNYTGYRWLFLSEDNYKNFLEDGRLEINKIGDMYENEFALISLFSDYESNKKIIDENKPTFIGIKQKGYINRLNLDKWLSERYNGLVFRPRNLEQKLLMYLVLNEDIKLVTVSGSSGKGKTALAIDYAKNYTEKGRFSQYVYTKSVIDTDKNEELGFLRGGLLEKFLPNLKPLNYTLESIENEKVIRNRNTNLKDTPKKSREFNSGTVSNIMEELDIMDNKYILSELQRGSLQILPLSKIRGMTIDNKAVVLDEGQNVKRHTMKSFISRVKDNSKVIITGDNDQIDDLNLNKYNNGFTHLIENGKNQEHVAHITLDLSKSTQRGKLSEFANEFL